MNLDELIESLMELRNELRTGEGKVNIAIMRNGATVRNKISNVTAFVDKTNDVWITARQNESQPYGPSDVWSS